MNSAYVYLKDIRYQYNLDDSVLTALDGLDLAIGKGEHVAILGRNGSGKSTLAKILAALLLPTEGDVVVHGLNSREETNIPAIRQVCTIVFQNPENQIIGNTVEEDIAFGPENLGIASDMIARRILQCAKMVGLEDKLQVAPYNLSGGQKQKLAIASVLAMEPRIIIFDESTSMLDPVSRRELINLISDLGRKYNLTIINITHYMEEALLSDRIFVMNKGKVEFHGCPCEVFKEVDRLRYLGLDVPLHTAIVADFYKACDRSLYGLDIVDLSTARKAALHLINECLAQGALRGGQGSVLTHARFLTSDNQAGDQAGDQTSPTKIKEAPIIISVRNLSYAYNADGQDNNLKAIDNLSFDVKKGEIVAIMGHTGSGKSTLIQHLNALIRPQTGEVKVFGMSTAHNKNVVKIRQQVAMLFQYPEHQLFADTVFEDVAFGPTCLGFKNQNQDLSEAVFEALDLVGLDKNIATRSPFEMSGGQKRRVALAGVLAVKPSVLILDEPVAGLDPLGKKRVLEIILSLRDKGVSIILVSHSMEDVAQVADRVLVLDKGKTAFWGSKEDLFAVSENRLAELSLQLPAGLQFMRSLQLVYPDLPVFSFGVEAAVTALLNFVDNSGVMGFGKDGSQVQMPASSSLNISPNPGMFDQGQCVQSEVDEAEVNNDAY